MMISLKTWQCTTLAMKMTALCPKAGAISITDDEAEDAQPGDEFWDEDQDRWFFFKLLVRKSS